MRKKTPDMSPTLKSAYAMQKALENMPVFLCDEDLLPGYLHDKSLAGILKNQILDNLIDTADIDSGIANSSALYHYNGIGPFALNYEKLMNVGFNGLIIEIENDYEKLTYRDRNYAAKKEYYEALLVEFRAVCAYIRRHTMLAYNKSKKENRPERAKELYQIARNCAQVAGGPAKNTWQALTLWHFVSIILFLETGNEEVFYGQIDKWLYPYYKHDIENHVISKDFAVKLLECAFLKTGNFSILKDFMSFKASDFSKHS